MTMILSNCSVLVSSGSLIESFYGCLHTEHHSGHIASLETWNLQRYLAFGYQCIDLLSSFPVFSKEEGIGIKWWSLYVVRYQEPDNGQMQRLSSQTNLLVYLPDDPWIICDGYCFSCFLQRPRIFMGIPSVYRLYFLVVLHRWYRILALIMPTYELFRCFQDRGWLFSRVIYRFRMIPILKDLW